MSLVSEGVASPEDRVKTRHGGSMGLTGCLSCTVGPISQVEFLR